MVAAYHLPLLTKHWPAALQVQGHSAEIETQLLQKSFCMACQDSNEGRERRLPLQLPNTIEVTSPGTAWIGIGAGMAPQSVQGLKMHRSIKRIGRELTPAKSNRKQRLDLQTSTRAQDIPAEPPTTSRISWVIAAWRALL